VSFATKREWQQSALILTSAFAVALSLAIRGNSCGHDFDFHLQSWMAVAQQWRHGIFYPHWIEGANYGAGEPRFVFYPPLSWMLGALLGTILPWSATPVAFTFIVMAASGFTMNKLAREYLAPNAATVAACAYILNPYALFVAYERTAYGELAAAIWLPLIVLYATRTSLLSRSSFKAPDTLDSPQDSTNPGAPCLASETWVFPRHTIPLALSIAAIWLTNAPAAVMTCYLLAAITVWRAVAQKHWQPIHHSATGLLLGLGLAAFYLVPAAYERRWVQIARAIGLGMRIQDSYLFGHLGESFHDQILRTASWIFVTMVATIVIAGAIAWKKKPQRKLIISLFVTTVVLLMLQLPVSALIWSHAPELKFLQFPWRLNLVLSVAFAIALAAIARPTQTPTRPAARTATILAIAIAIVAAGSWLFWQPCDEEDIVSAQVTVFQSGNGFDGTDEYTPLGADNSEVPRDLPRVRVLKAADAEIATSPAPNSTEDQEAPTYTPSPPDELPAQLKIENWQPEAKTFTIITQPPGYAVLRLMDYPTWQVRANGQEVANRPQRDDGLMAIPVEAGQTHIEITYPATPDVLWGRSLTAASLLSLLLLGLVPQKPARVGLSGIRRSSPQAPLPPGFSLKEKPTSPALTRRHLS